MNSDNTLESISLDQNLNLSSEDNYKVNLTEEDLKNIELYKSKIDLTSISKVIEYGSSGQTQISSFSSQILSQVKTKDLGSATDILLNLKENISSFDQSMNQGCLFSFFDSMKKRVVRLKSKYDAVEKNIRDIELKLERHYQILSKDVKIFDKLFDQNKFLFKDITLYIIAGNEKIKEMREVILPKMKEELTDSSDQLKLQSYKDLDQQTDRFEKKIHDLKLTRMITLQTAPQIRMIQNNSSTLMEKIHSSIVNTIPLWKNQMVLTLGIANTQEALKVQKALSDATNELLVKNSEMLKDSSIKIAQENERGIIDIESIKKANSDIISTIDEVLRIQDSGREQRLSVEQELIRVENEFREAISKSVENQKYIA